MSDAAALVSLAAAFVADVAAAFLYDNADDALEAALVASADAAASTVAMFI